MLIVNFHRGKAYPFIKFPMNELTDPGRGKDMSQLLQEFEELRKENLQTLQSFNLSEKTSPKKVFIPFLAMLG